MNSLPPKKDDVIRQPINEPGLSLLLAFYMSIKVLKLEALWM